MKKLVYLIVVMMFSAAFAGSYDDFFDALLRDDATMVSRLLQRGFDSGTPDPKGRVPLALALQTDRDAVAEALWRDPKLKYDQVNANGETPLMIAALVGKLDWVRRLAERGAALTRDGWAPLHYAASGPSTPVVDWLLGQGVPMEARSPNGTTPLMMAAGYGAESSVDALLQRGASASARNDLGLDAAAFARRAGRDALARRLDAAAR